MSDIKKAVQGYNPARLRSGRLENTPIYNHVYSSPSSSSSSRTQNPRKRIRSVHCVQYWDKTPSAEERSGWLSGPSCSALSPGGGSGWAGNIGRAYRGSQRKGEGGKTFNRPPPSRYSSSISLCYCSRCKANGKMCAKVPRYWGQHIQEESQSSQQRGGGKGCETFFTH